MTEYLYEWRDRIGVEVMHAMTCLHVAADFGNRAVCNVCFSNTQRIGALIERAVRGAWDQGYTSGHSNAMRQMSDEPSAPTTPNPYRPDPARAVCRDETTTTAEEAK